MMTEEQGTLEFAPDRSTAGFRLHRFSVLNWGTFHGRIHDILPEGRTSLLSGSNGSGKSTLADAMLTLLIDSRKRNYNQASAGGGERKQRKERTEKDYVLGTYSEEHDQDLGYRRPKQLRKAGESVTVVLAYFFNETYQQHVTLAQVLWLTASKKLERAYVVAKQKLTIEGDFSELGSPAEVRKRLKDRALEPLDTFTAYSQRFHDALCLSADRNPMEIFNQAICIKDISNLTNFIRDYMLDDGGAPQKLEDLRNNFEELRRTYERIEREKQRLDELNEIQRLHIQVQVHGNQVEHWNSCLHVAPLFFAKKELELRTVEANGIDLELTKVKAERETESRKAEQSRNHAQELDAAIGASDAGKRLQEIKKGLVDLQGKIDEKRPRYEKWISRASTWRKGLVCQSEAEFLEVLNDAHKDVGRLQQKSEELDTALKEQKSECSEIEEQQEQISIEIRSLQEREGNIEDRLMRRRNRIADALGVNPKALPFVGELVQVRESEARWTGAIERLVHSFALCVLVPERLRRRMDQHVHATNLKGLLVYHIVDKVGRIQNTQVDAQAVANKLELHEKAGEFKAWLVSELSHRFDHRCCESPDDTFNQSKTAITMNGLIKQRGSERRKDDRTDINDRSKDVLGWDNSGKIEALRKKNQGLENRRAELKKSIHFSGKEKEAVDVSLRAAESLSDIATQWDEVDYLSPAQKQEDLKIERQDLEASSDELKALEAQFRQAKLEEESAREKADNATKRLGSLETSKEHNDAGIQQCRAIIDAAQQDPETLEKLEEKVSALRGLMDIPAISITGVQESRESVVAELQSKQNEANRARDTAGINAKSRMKDFLNRIKNEEPKLHDSLYSEGIHVGGYSEDIFEPYENLRTRILEEDLPKNQKRFNQLLQTNLVEDVSTFDGLLDQHAKAIQRRIEDLNKHLKEVDFDRNKLSYIQLVPERTSDEHQKWFRNLRHYALENIIEGESTEEQRKERFNRVRHLVNSLAEDEKRTQRVIDVRNWFTFRADEFFRDGDRYDQSYSGASGKSGGEKNRLASTILATAIAYQYGISLDNQRQTETFRLVMVDEMFSKTDDEFSTYLLELFKKFSLQLIIVQPLDSKVHLVHKYAERYHIVTRPNEISEIHNLSVHEYEKLLVASAEK